MATSIDNIFDAKIAQRGGMVRRSRHVLEREGTFQTVMAEAARRGFHVYEIDEQILFICTATPRITKLLPPA